MFVTNLQYRITLKNSIRKLEKKATANNKLKNLFAAISILTIFTFIIFSIGFLNIDNYQNWASFIFISIMIGIVLGILINFILCKVSPESSYYKSKNGTGFLTIILINSIFLSFGICRFLNEKFIIDKVCKSYSIEEKGFSGGRRPSYWIWILDETEKTRLNFGKTFYEEKEVKDSINLCKVSGFFGLQYFKINSKN